MCGVRGVFLEGGVDVRMLQLLYLELGFGIGVFESVLFRKKYICNIASTDTGFSFDRQIDYYVLCDQREIRTRLGTAEVMPSSFIICGVETYTAERERVGL